MARTAYLIFNPVSGHGDAEADLAYLQSQFDPAFDLVVYETTPELGADLLAKQSLQQDADLVIVSGGDGTINAVAGSLMETAIPLGIVPRGTANAVASALGIPTDLQGACQVILTGKPHMIDIARCNGHPMVLLAGIGLEADVIKRASRETKDRWGILAYILASFKQLNELESFEVTLETDDKIISVPACAVTVANMAPPTSILAQGPVEVIVDDGLLDITIVVAQGIGSTLAASYELFRSAMSGQATAREDIGFLRSKRVKVSTDPLQRVALDGEMIDAGPVEIVCVPKGLNLIMPQQPPSASPENITELPGITIELKTE